MNDPQICWRRVTDELPEKDAPVLFISKFHHISSAKYTNYGVDDAPILFRPHGYRPGEDVSWWMPVPEDAWKDFEIEKPRDAGFYLTRENYGSITSQKWTLNSLTGEYEFRPFGTGFNMGRLKSWREIPPLPKGVFLI